MYPGSHLATRADEPALIWAPTGTATTFAELDAAANRLSRLLRTLGVEPGDHVALCLENHPRYAEVLWGCHYAGAVYTAASSRLTPGELDYIVDDCGAKVFISSHHLAELAGAIVTTTPGVSSRLMLDGTIPGYTSVRGQRRRPRPHARWPDRLAGTDMLYSSGTTGRPKGVSVRSRRRSPGDHGEQRHAAPRRPLRVHLGRRLPLARPDVPRRPAALRDGRQRHRQHRRADRSLRRRGVPGDRRALPRDDCAGRADDVRPPAQAAQPTSAPATTSRHCVASSTLRRRVRCPSRSR